MIFRGFHLAFGVSCPTYEQRPTGHHHCSTFVKSCIDLGDIDDVMWTAAENGHVDVVGCLTETGAHKDGHVDVVRYLTVVGR